MTAQSKLRAAPFLLTLAMLVFGTAFSPFQNAPSFQTQPPEEWSFEDNPVPMADQLTPEDLRREMNATEALGVNDFCPATVAFRYIIYRETYPRFELIADSPRAFQRFLHNAAERAIVDGDLCFPMELVRRYRDSGSNRCNFGIGSQVTDHVLRQDFDQIILLVEKRHIMTVEYLLQPLTYIESNKLLLSTKIYLMQFLQDPNMLKRRRADWHAEMMAQDPKRYAFIIEAAKRNDFRAVLRTNPPCRLIGSAD